MCMGVHALHQKGVLHRDLKTANIFLDDQNDVRIGDFGLARQNKYAGSNSSPEQKPRNNIS